MAPFPSAAKKQLQEMTNTWPDSSTKILLHFTIYDNYSFPLNFMEQGNTKRRKRK
jgi:hypothetical protein